MGFPGTICERHRTVDKERVVAVVCDTLSRNDHVVFAYLFGSVSRGTATPMSDIDIAVYLHDLADGAEVKLELLGQLMHDLETDDVDLVILNTAPLTLQARVIRDRVILKDRNPYQRHAFESLVMRQYLDFSIFESAILKRRFSLG